MNKKENLRISRKIPTLLACIVFALAGCESTSSKVCDEQSIMLEVIRATQLYRLNGNTLEPTRKLHEPFVLLIRAVDERGEQVEYIDSKGKVFLGFKNGDHIQYIEKEAVSECSDTYSEPE